jgi:tRNA-specific 2-thiouridylase
MEQGFDYVATGHYAKITTESQPDGSNHHLLTIPADTHKDQTYFLCQLREDQLTKTLFPLADLTKQQVRDLATQWQLPTAAKKDSTGVCFVGEVSLRDFLSQKITLTPGNVVDIAGNIVGSHQGAAAYTLGQRHGFTVFNQAPDTPPLYVIKKDISRNQLVIGDQAATARHILVVPSFHFINLELSSWRDPDVLSAVDFFVRIRHTSPLLPARIALTSTTKNYHLVSIFLSGPVYGVGEGQFAVLYAAAGDILFCLGGGAIAN